MISDEDRKVLIRQEDHTLAEWWCALNRWDWPEQLPNPEPTEARPMSMSRRMMIMTWIDDMVGMKLCSRVWNKKMTDQEFEDFWKGNFEGDTEAKARYNAYLERVAKEHEENRRRAT